MTIYFVHVDAQYNDWSGHIVKAESSDDAAQSIRELGGWTEKNCVVVVPLDQCTLHGTDEAVRAFQDEARDPRPGGF